MRHVPNSSVEWQVTHLLFLMNHFVDMGEKNISTTLVVLRPHRFARCLRVNTLFVPDLTYLGKRFLNRFSKLTKLGSKGIAICHVIICIHEFDQFSCDFVISIKIPIRTLVFSETTHFTTTANDSDNHSLAKNEHYRLSKSNHELPFPMMMVFHYSTRFRSLPPSIKNRLVNSIMMSGCGFPRFPFL